MSDDFTEEIEYGRIVVLLKDGSEGSALSVTGDVQFGRDKSSDIRIKLSSVSREHALLSVDQNGIVSVMFMKLPMYIINLFPLLLVLSHDSVQSSTCRRPTPPKSMGKT